MRILIAEDSEGIRISLQEVLKENHDTLLAEDGAIALKILGQTTVDVVITDNVMPNLTGLELIKQGKVLSPSTSFVLMTAFSSIEEGLEAIRLGADEYFTKPFQLQEVLHRVGRIEELRLWKAKKEWEQAKRDQERLVGSSPAAMTTLEFIKKAAAANMISVLLQGPSGSGRTSIARMIHHAGSRTSQPFLSLNCATLREKSLGAEIFGQEKGAPSTVTVTQGIFELATSGTLLLEEVDSLSPALQTKLLPLLQRHEFRRLGGTVQVKSGARFIATAQRPLKEMVKNGEFNGELSLCLNGLSLEVPALKERPKDIPLLIENYWEKLSHEWGRQPSLSQEVIQCLTAYDYPGNIRELENLLERLMILGANQNVIDVRSLPEEVRTGGRAEKKSKAA
jgi:two-component system, NtrC family, response regulator PilR